MKPLYRPKGAAREYGNYAVNLYTGCPHCCSYCFAPSVLHRNRENFHGCVEPRPGLIEALRSQIEREGVTGELIHFCFTCDPYPAGKENSVTREAIQVIKESGNHVQILTKGDARRDFDLLDGNDWFGVSYSCADPLAVIYEPYAVRPSQRIEQVAMARRQGIKTWVSFEPVLSADDVLNCIRLHHSLFNKVKIGKLNYYSSEINWKTFGEQAEALCGQLGLECYIKESLRRAMRAT